MVSITSSHLNVSPLKRRKKISLASMNIFLFKADQQTSSNSFLGNTPYGLAINSNLPALNPKCSFLVSSIWDKNWTAFAILSACAIGPPLASKLITAEPISIFLVLRKDSRAS